MEKEQILKFSPDLRDFRRYRYHGLSAACGGCEYRHFALPPRFGLPCRFMADSTRSTLPGATCSDADGGGGLEKSIDALIGRTCSNARSTSSTEARRHAQRCTARRSGTTLMHGQAGLSCERVPSGKQLQMPSRRP